MTSVKWAVIVFGVLFVSQISWPQSSAPKSAIVRVVSKDSNKIPGTGFIVKLEPSAAYVLTASHVVDRNAPVTIEFFTQRDKPLPARIITSDDSNSRGLALLLVSGRIPGGLTSLTLDAISVNGGESILILGHPASSGSWATSAGIVSSREGNVIYFSAPLDKGNSGGPLLLGEKVVGIVTHKGSTFGEALGSLAVAEFLQRNGVYKNYSSGMKPGQMFKDCEDCPEMVVIPAGQFLMGSRQTSERAGYLENPQHAVNIPRPLALGKTEVTRGQFSRFVMATGHRDFYGCSILNTQTQKVDLRDDKNWKDPGFVQADDHPVVCVTWHDVDAYVQWLRKKTGRQYRLPSEAEWEYAARAGTESARYWGETFEPEGCKHANILDVTAARSFAKNWPYSKCSDQHAFTAPVGSYNANKFGLQNMLGNAAELTADCLHDSYKGAPGNGDAWRDINCSYLMVRGGSWADEAASARVAYRTTQMVNAAVSDVGFRVVRDD
jgi:formylglycine-generating enzyme required for sulfatase activity